MGFLGCFCGQADSADPAEPRSADNRQRAGETSTSAAQRTQSRGAGKVGGTGTSPGRLGRGQPRPTRSEPSTRKTVAFSVSTTGMADETQQAASPRARSTAPQNGSEAASLQPNGSIRAHRSLSRTTTASTDAAARSMWASNASVGNASNNSSRITKNCSYRGRSSLGDEDGQDGLERQTGAPPAGFTSTFDPLDNASSEYGGTGSRKAKETGGASMRSRRGLSGVDEECSEVGDAFERPCSDFDEEEDLEEDYEDEDLDGGEGPSGTKRSTSTWSVKVMAQLQLVPDRDGRLRLPSILMFTQRRPPRETRTQAWWTKIRGVLVDVGHGIAAAGGGGGGAFSRAASNTTTGAPSRVWSRRTVSVKDAAESRTPSLARQNDAAVYDQPGALPGTATESAPSQPGPRERREPRPTQGGAPPSCVATASATVTLASPVAHGGAAGVGGGPPAAAAYTSAGGGAAPLPICSGPSRRPSSAGSGAGGLAARRSGSGRANAAGGLGGGLGRCGSGRGPAAGGGGGGSGSRSASGTQAGALAGPQSEPLQRAAGAVAHPDASKGRPLNRISDDGAMPAAAIVSAGRGLVTPPRSPLLSSAMAQTRPVRQLPPLAVTAPVSPLLGSVGLTCTPTEDLRRCSAVGDTLSPRPDSPTPSPRPSVNGGSNSASGSGNAVAGRAAATSGGPVAEELEPGPEWSQCYRHLPGHVERSSLPM